MASLKGNYNENENLRGAISASSMSLQASLNAGGGSSATPYFVGDISDFTEDKPFNLNNIKPGQYVFSNKLGINYLYFSAKYKNAIYTNRCFFLLNGIMYADSIILNMYQKIDDSLESGSHIANLSFIDADELTGEIDFKDTFIILYDGGLSFSTGYISIFHNVTTDLNQTITGLKTFNILPESSLIPTLNTQFVNKQYVDTSSIQKNVMPVASEDYLGKIIQYIGTTNQNYTNGYFYKCVYNNGTYNWENINTQEDNGIYFLGSASDYTQQTPLDLNNLTAQKYLIYSNATEIYVTGTYNNKTSILKIKIAGSYTLSPAIIFDMQKVLNNDLANSTVFAQVRYSSMASSELNGVETNIKTDSALGISQYSSTYGLTYFENPYSQQTISAKRTFQQAPVCTGEITADNNLITKKYADNKVLITLYTQSGLAEYNNTSTYAVDDYVYYNNLIYKCNTAVTVAEDFDSNKWTQKTYTEYWYELLIGTALGGSY